MAAISKCRVDFSAMVGAGVGAVVEHICGQWEFAGADCHTTVYHVVKRAYTMRLKEGMQ